MDIILASESFLRNFIFSATKLPYKKVPADMDESIFDHEPVEQRVVSLARAKCEKVAADHPSDFIISADTLITLGGAVFTKPKTPEEAFQRTLGFSGKSIEVFTGAATYSPRSGVETYLAHGKVRYMEFTEDDLRRLTTEDNPQIRNGLGVFTDSPGFTLVERWEGSYTGLMGLPMEFVYPQLRKAGLLNG
ncbi:MAG TPA: Maf family protein [Candidatus Saccharimonadales bacterium]|nr:Maf family protein [Candidatus Saccharimonadales bacterium]